MGERGQRSEIRDANQGIGTHLAEQHPGSVGDGAPDGLEVLKIDDRGRYPKPAEVVAKKGQRRAVAIVGRHHMVAGIHLTHQRDGDGGHP